MLGELIGTSKVEPVADERFVTSGTPNVVREFKHDKPVLDLAVSGDGAYFATTSLDGYTYLFDASNGIAKLKFDQRRS